jgi:hypothetical protein
MFLLSSDGYSIAHLVGKDYDLGQKFEVFQFIDFLGKIARM